VRTNESTDAHVQYPFLRLHIHGHQLCRATTIKLLRPPPSRFVQPLPIPAPPRDFSCFPHPAIPGRISLLFSPTLQCMQSLRQRKNHDARRAHSELCWVPVRTCRMGGLACVAILSAPTPLSRYDTSPDAPTVPRRTPLCFPAYHSVRRNCSAAEGDQEGREDGRTDTAHLQQPRTAVRIFILGGQRDVMEETCAIVRSVGSLAFG
jgi:hypothetical protein